MPYNLAKDVGGDTPALDAKVERCVARLVDRGYSKSSAVAVCKKSVQDRARKDQRK